jgi:hypothetical protein
MVVLPLVSRCARARAEPWEREPVSQGRSALRCGPSGRSRCTTPHQGSVGYAHDRRRGANRKLTFPLALDCRFYEPEEQRVRVRRSRLQLGVCLSCHKVRVRLWRELDEFNEPAVGRGPADDQPCRLQFAAVLVVDLVGRPSSCRYLALLSFLRAPLSSSVPATCSA